MTHKERQNELLCLQEDRLRVQRQAERMIALKPEHAESYQHMLAKAEREIAAKAEAL